MNIAIIGKGQVGTALGPAFAHAGHQVIYGVRDPADGRHDNGDGLPRATVAQAAAASDVVILAVMWPAVPPALSDCGELSGKVLIDCTNPLEFDAQGGLSLALGFTTSAAEVIAGQTRATVVKTLNQVGAPVMASARRAPFRPIQFVCADDADALTMVCGLLRDIGFAPIEYGRLANARKLEPMAAIWIDQAKSHGMDTATAWQLTSTAG